MQFWKKQCRQLVDQYLIPVEKNGNYRFFAKFSERYFWWGQKNYMKLQKNYHTIFG
jgi:hypothetical protein